MSDRSKVVQSRTFDLPAFEFDSGERLDLIVHFQTQGTLVPSGENAVMMLHGTTGSGNQFLLPGTATALFGRGQPLDLDRYFIILPDAIGHGLSSKPSDGLGTGFPKYSYGPLSLASYPVATGRPRPGHQRPRAR
jgi:homoserine O-acetyltransferase/O-succinyltransferase